MPRGGIEAEATAMNNGGRRDRTTAIVSSLSFLIATMSLAAAFYQGYLNTRNLEIIQRDVARREYIRTCKEIIETYFDVKLKVGSIMAAASRERPAAAESLPELEALVAVSRFGALGTFLANFQDEGVRTRYTALTHELGNAVAAARQSGPRDLDKLFEGADRLFGQMNDDCVKLSKVAM
jgi:hypothetical protein